MVTKNYAAYKNNECTFPKDKEMEPVPPVQTNIYHSKIYKSPK